ncbi:MAG: chemotaxis protein CheA [Candidatus Latescibacterota bacterium]
MSPMEIVDLLVQEALLLDPGNLKSCGKMLSLLDSLDHPGIIREKIILREYLESMIMQEIEGGGTDVNTILGAVETIQVRLQEILSGDAPASGKTSGPGENGDNDLSSKTISDNAEFLEEDSGFLRDFIQEASEHLHDIEINMVEWERNPDDREIINSIFRPFHTIKGVAGFLNLHEVNHLSHQLENLLDEVRDGRIRHSPELSDLIFEGVDILKRRIFAIDNALKNSLPVTYDIDFEDMRRRLEEFISAFEQKTEDAQPDSEKRLLGDILVCEGKIPEEKLLETLRKQTEDHPGKLLGKILVEEDILSPRDVGEAVRKQAESGKSAVERSIKVDTIKLDQLLDMVGELMIAQSMVTHNPKVKQIGDPRFLRDIAQLGRVTATLQNISMSMRLVPIGATFQKMNRIVRDIARKSGKKIALVIEGQSAEIDRNMVEELYDPLVHMIRNSCDHGIGAPEERKLAGKSEEGTILLRAEHSGGKVIITISDDGSGLNREAILNKARARGIIHDDEHPSDREIDNLIFMPGFSTAKQVTEISGRGVGMDVVKKTMERLRGTVEISSGMGKGTTFCIKLPLTTAIIDGMLVQVGSERYIIPTLMVRRIIRPEPKDVSMLAGQGEIVRAKDRLLPVIRLEQALGIEGAKTDLFDSVLIIVEDSGKEAALRVDALLGKQEVVIKNLGEKFKDLKRVAGGAILGDGKIGLILDIRAIVNSKEAAL